MGSTIQLFNLRWGGKTAHFWSDLGWGFLHCTGTTPLKLPQVRLSSSSRGHDKENMKQDSRNI